MIGFRNIFLLGAVTLAWTLSNSETYTDTVETTYGPVRGVEIKSDGVKFKSFKGIPYAEPPLGELRFKAPQPPQKWTSVRDASKYGSICHQPASWMLSRISWKIQSIWHFLSNLRNTIDILLRFIQPSEDCLYLNVYTTHIGETDLRPVMVYIHGGGFIFGDSTDTMYGPEFLIQKDIVVVTMNYRLGVLGFLATNTSDAPGNWGLKDQVAALKWVQENIAQFRGDPKQVTISGASSGAASVQFHLISPLSRGLFHRAIATSGSATCSWALNGNPDRISRSLARVTGASSTEVEDSAKRVQFLKQLDAKTLINGMTSMRDEQSSEHGIFTEIPFAPVVEPAGTVGAFLTDDPKKLLAEGRFARVPILTGINSLEGAILFMGFSKIKSVKDLKKLDINICKILPERLKRAIEARDYCEKVNQEALRIYFRGNSTRSSPLEFTYLFGDLALAYPTMYSHAVHARYAKKENPAYFYYFAYDGEWKILKDLFAIKLPGVIHGDDLNYVFKPKLRNLPELSPTSSGHYTNKRMVEFTSNFVKYGNPTPKVYDLIPITWEPSTRGEINVMVIDSKLKMEKNCLQDRLSFWDMLYKNFLPNDPY